MVNFQRILTVLSNNLPGPHTISFDLRKITFYRNVQSITRITHQIQLNPTHITLYNTNHTTPNGAYIPTDLNYNDPQAKTTNRPPYMATSTLIKAITQHLKANGHDPTTYNNKIYTDYHEIHVHPTHIAIITDCFLIYDTKCLNPSDPQLLTKLTQWITQSSPSLPNTSTTEAAPKMPTTQTQPTTPSNSTQTTTHNSLPK